MSTALHKAIAAVTDNGLPVTLAGSASATLFWGLHISDLAVIISALAAVAGVVIQFYVAMRRIHIVEQAVSKTDNRAAVAGLVATAAAVSNRNVADRVTDLEKKLDG